MKIHKLVVNNFKSYKGITEVDFGQNYFSAIIGPNGVGKSNLMDAISFVFGSSLVDLRTKTYLDLIWRDPEGGSETQTAYVEAHFETIVFRRELGADATHFVDNERVSEQEYLDALAEIGISKQKNSLVFQGSIEKMASLSPTQLGALFEDISGSDDYKSEYEELAAQVATKRQDATSAGRARSKQLTLVKRLSTGREVARERTRLTTQIDRLAAKENNLRLAILDCRVSECEQEAKRLKREKKLAAKNQVTSTREAQLVKKQLVSTIREIQKYEDDLRSTQNSAKRATAGLLSAQSQLSTATHKLDDIEPQLECAQDELKLFVSETAKLEAALATSKKNSQRLLDEIPQYEGDMDIYNECNQQFEVETALEQAEIDRIRRRSSALEAELDALTTQLQSHQTRTSQLRHQQKMAALKVKESQAKEERYTRQETDIKEEYELVMQELGQTRTSVSRLENKLRTKAQKLKEMQSDKRRTEQRNSLLERVHKLKRKFSGVVGVVYTLIQPKEEQFTSAVDLILGANFNAVVVDSISTAKQCIEFAHSNNLGAMTFLPLDGLTPKTIDSRLRSVEGARLAIDAVNYEREFSAAVAYVCGDTLLCDSTDIAYSLRAQDYRVKLVSIDGTVLQSNGIVTAGSYETNRFDKTRAATLRSEVAELVEDLKSQKFDETALSEKSFSISERLEVIKTKKTQLADQLALENTALEAFSKDLQSCERKQRDLEDLEESVRGELHDCELEMNQVKRGFSSLKKQIFKPFTETCEVDINTFQDSQERRTKLIADRNKQNARLEEEIGYARSKQEAARARVELLQDQHTKLKELQTSAMPKIEQCQDTLASSKEAVAALQDQINIAEAEVESLNAQLVELQGKELDRGDETDELDEQIKSLEETCRKTEEQRELIDGVDEEKVVELIEEFETAKSLQEELERVQGEEHRLAAEREKLVGSDSEGLDEAEETLAQLSQELEDAQGAVNASERALNKVKTKRTKKFMEVFEPVQEAVKLIYKELTTTKIDPLGGTATLRPINETEPYLEGIIFSAMPPRKPFTQISSLSGGEKTIAALALIFALNTYRSSPIYVLDEVDAALDYANVHLVARYIHKCAEEGSQFIVISLKLWFFEHADNLLGVYRKKDEAGSKLISYALTA